MSKRLQVLLDEDELETIQTIASQQRMTTAEWVRRALREAAGREPIVDSGRKLMAIRAASRHAFPTADIDVLLSDIERGYGAHE